MFDILKLICLILPNNLNVYQQKRKLTSATTGMFTIILMVSLDVAFQGLLFQAVI